MKFKRPPSRKLKHLSEEEVQAMEKAGMADLVTEDMKKSTEKKPLTDAQIRLLEARSKAWLTFKYALSFRVWERITGELPKAPNKGTYDINGRPKDGRSPQAAIIQHMGVSIPFQKHEHAVAYSVIAEMYELTPPDQRPDGKLWESLLPQAESLIDKWCGEREPILKMDFPDALKTARMEKRMSQGEVADEIGYQDLAVSRWERGETQPSPQAIFELARVFDQMKKWFRAHKEWVKERGGVAVP